jgi:PAS domain S-box-containing protein
MDSARLPDSLRETLALFDEVGTPQTTTEVTERLDLGRRGVYDRLERLVEKGYLETKKVGASARVWWRPSASTPDLLSSSEEAGVFLGDLFDDSGIGAFVLDEGGRVVWHNGAVARYFGLEGEIDGREKSRLVEEQIAPVVADSESFAETVLATYETDAGDERFECRVTPGEGREERWLEHRSKPVKSGPYAGGRVEFYYDVTERKRSEQTHWRDRKKFESLVETVEEYAIFTLDPEGHVRTWNPGVERITGYGREEILGEHSSTFYTEADRAEGVPERNLERAAEEGSIEDEGWRVRADGSRFWATVTITAIRDDDGDLQGFAEVTRDSTEHREYEQRLREEKAFVESLLGDQQDLFYAYDADGVFFRWSDSFSDVTGYADEEIASMRPTEFIADEAVEETTAAMERILEHGETVTIELPLETADGEVIPYEFTGGPIRDEDGDIVGATGAGRDVSERAARERRLRRQRDDLERELADVFQRIDEAFFALDEEWQFTYVNESAKALIDIDESVIGNSIWEAFPESRGTTFEEQYRRAMETQERVTFEEYFGPLDTWFEVTAHPSESGLSIYFRDVTERKRRERVLERYEAIVETVEDGIYAVDENSRFVMVNDAFCELTGYDRTELIGAHVSTVHEIEAEVESMLAEMLTSGQDVASIDVEIQSRSGAAIPCETRFSPFPTGEGVYGRCGVIRDITEHLERKAELETQVRQQEAITELGQTALVSLDPDALMAEASERVAEILDNDYCKVLEFDPEAEELLVRQGEGWDPGVVGSATVSAVEDGSQASYALRSEEPVIVEDLETESRFGGSTLLTDHGVRSGISTIIGPPEDPWGILGTHDTEREAFTEHDVNFVQSVANILAGAIARYANERDLVRQREQLETRERALSEAYRIIGAREPFEERVDALLSLVRETIGTDYATLSNVQGERYVFEAVDAPSDADLEAGDTTPLEGTNCERAVATEQTLALQDVEADAPELADRGGNAEWGISCYLGTPVTVDGEVYGTFCFYDMEARSEEFSDWEVAFVELLGNWVGAEMERRQYTDRLTALNSLHGVVQEITHSVLEQSTREEIEETVCDYLADTDSYQFAWVGGIDVTSQTVTPRAEAGAGDYLDDLTISIDPDDEHSSGPTGRAFRTREIEVSQDVQTDPRYEPWQEVAERHGFRSSAAVPIVHEDVVYGVLNLYAERAYAFESEEREVVSRLGEVVGHAIAAAEQRRALMSDDVVELDFQIPNLFETIGVGVDPTGTIRIDHAIPLGDDEFLVYGSATPDAISDLEALAETVSHWEEVSLDREEDGRDDGDDVGFELRLSEPPVLSALASMGGSIEEAVIEGGDYHMTLHLSPNVEVRQFVGAVQEAYPTAEMVTRRRITRPEDGSDHTRDAPTADLTERQRAALEAAYRAGFFEWPRNASGEEVAESLGVTPPTFHQHLRAAEGKIVDSLLSESIPASG